MKNILHALYFGHFAACERPPVRTPEHIAINRKIEAEKQYFVLKMSLDDCARFQALEGLYAQAQDFGEFDAFSSGFKLGVTLMCAAFMNGEVG